MQSSGWYCDCCRSPIGKNAGPDCLVCGYPIDPAKEKEYLNASIFHLQRELRYRGWGPNLYVRDLLRCQQNRLQKLQQEPTAIEQAQSSMHFIHSDVQASVSNPAVSSQIAPESVPERSANLVNDDAESATGSQATAHSTSSRRAGPSIQTFFADQSINIVASLGAFLILIGSLSFIITTKDLLLAFLVLLVVHAIFGLIGSLTFKIQRLRVVSVIYTAIFALQVPLVGFSALRLFNHDTTLPAMTTLIMLACLYAMLTYGALAIYQRFKPFGYLAALALFIALSMVPSVLQLSSWWYGCVFLLGALGLVWWTRPRGFRPAREQVPWEYVREPALMLMWTWIGVSLCFILYNWSLTYFPTIDPVGVHLSLVVMLTFLLVWVCLLATRTRRYGWFNVVPTLVLCWGLAVVYAWSPSVTAYVVALTFLVAVAVWIRRRYADGFLQLVPGMTAQLAVFAILLSIALPVLIDPWLGLQLFARAYHVFPGIIFSGGSISAGELVIDLLSLIIASLLIGWMIVTESGTSTAIAGSKPHWLLIIPLALFSYTYGIVLLWSGIDPVWGVLALGLVCALATALLYRVTGKRTWTVPMMAWMFVIGVVSFGLVVLHGVDGLLFAQLPVIAWEMVVQILVWYALAMFTREKIVAWLTVPFMLAVLLCSRQLFWVPVLSVAIALILGVIISRRRDVQWALPLYAIALLAALCTCLQGWLPGVRQPFYNAFPFTLCLYALIVYVVALVQRRPQFILLAVGLVAWAIVCTSLTYVGWVLVFSLLFVLTMVSGYVWSVLVPRNGTSSGVALFKLLAVLGLCGVLVFVMWHDNFMPLLPSAYVPFVHLHTAVLAVLSLLVFGAGLSWEPTPRVHLHITNWACIYGAMIVLSWVPGGEIAGWGVTDISLFYLWPALCMLGLSVLIARNERLVSAYHWSQFCAVIGACLLLGPTLFLSFSEANVQPSLILGGEALALLFVSFLLRARVLLLFGIATVIVTAIHILFLPSLGIPSFLALSLTGILLLGSATIMLVIRPRLTVLWSEMS